MQNCSFCIWWEMYDKHCRIVLETKINVHFCISQNHSVLLIHYFLFICFHTQIEQPNTLLQHWNVDYKSQRFLHFCLSLTCLSLTKSERAMLNFQLFTPKVKKKKKKPFLPRKCVSEKIIITILKSETIFSDYMLQSVQIQIYKHHVKCPIEIFYIKKQVANYSIKKTYQSFLSLDLRLKRLSLKYCKLVLANCNAFLWKAW